jgi:hypothetical protein
MAAVRLICSTVITYTLHSVQIKAENYLHDKGGYQCRQCSGRPHQNIWVNIHSLHTSLILLN